MRGNVPGPGHSLFVRKSKRQLGKRVIHTSKWCTLYVLQCTQAHIAKALDIDKGISSVFRQISNICSELFLSDPSPIIALPCKSVTNAFVEFCSNYWILSFASDCEYKKLRSSSKGCGGGAVITSCSPPCSFFPPGIKVI